MKIHYLYHSGFAVELNDILLVFDYFKVSKDGFAAGGISEEEIRRFRKVYFFASHSHSDHFNKGIFEYAGLNPNTLYVLDSGILLKGANVPHKFVDPGDTLSDEDVFVRMFKSTDLGVSFYVECGGNVIFHAGDLNCWHWAGEWSKEEENAARSQFEEALKEIEDTLHKQIDAAFFPVDARMQGEYDEGARRFAETLRPKYMIPMHFWKDVAVAEKFGEHVPEGIKVLVPEARGKSFEI